MYGKRRSNGCVWVGVRFVARWASSSSSSFSAARRSTSEHVAVRCCVTAVTLVTCVHTSFMATGQVKSQPGMYRYFRFQQDQRARPPVRESILQSISTGPPSSNSREVKRTENFESFNPPQLSSALSGFRFEYQSRTPSEPRSVTSACVRGCHSHAS